MSNYRTIYAKAGQCVASLIQDILESEENNAVGIVKVVPHNLKSKALDFLHPLPPADRQSVQKVAHTACGEVYEMGFTRTKPMNVLEFGQIAKLMKPEDPTLDVEESAWRNLQKRSERKDKTISKRPVYAINLTESLFEKGEPWNMNEFTSKHSIINGLEENGKRVPGVNSAYVNIGMLFTWFCLHTEDSDLASLNIVHSGAPKYWYCIPASEAEKLESLLKRLLGKKYDCETVFRHKCFVLHPSLLEEAGIKFVRVIQNAGEIIFTMYKAYHFGFNAGVNVCESSNLASPRYRDVHPLAVLCSSKCSYGLDTNYLHEKIGQLINKEDAKKDDAKKEDAKEEEEIKAVIRCEKCNATFSRNSVKLIHDRTYHGDFVTIYECEFCELESMSRANILTHHRSIHGDIPTPAEIRSTAVKNTEEFQAERLRQKARPPKRIGTIKPKTCQICKKEFKNGAKHLNVHMKRVHKSNYSI